MSLQMFPEKDPTGTDVVMTRIEMEITFQWSPFATSSIPPGGNLFGGDAPAGNDALGLSLRNLRKQLTEARKQLNVAFAADQVWQCPAPIAGEQTFVPPGQDAPARSDPGFGPQPTLVSLAEVIGDKLAVGRWRVTFWVAESSNILLSNRWTVTVTTNKAGLSTRHIEGWAQCRADSVVAHDVQGITDFHKWFLCPCPSGFVRSGAVCDVNTTNTIAHYRCDDVEDPNPLGTDGGGCGAVEMEGEITAGIVSVNKTVGQKLRAGIEVAATLGIALIFQMPNTVSQGWIKITGGKNSDKMELMKLAIGVAQDRFFVGQIVALTVTQGIGMSERGGRWVKVSCVFIPNLLKWVGTAWNSIEYNILSGGFVNMANDIKPYDRDANFNPIPKTRNGAPMVFHGNTPPDETNTDYKNFNLPNAGAGTGVVGHDTGARGSWLGAIITQAIQYQGNVPEQVPLNGPAIQSDLV